MLAAHERCEIAGQELGVIRDVLKRSHCIGRNVLMKFLKSVLTSLVKIPATCSGLPSSLAFLLTARWKIDFGVPQLTLNLSSQFLSGLRHNVPKEGDVLDFL